MRKLILIISSVILILECSCVQHKRVYKDDYIVKTGDLAPDFMINEAGGTSYRLTDLRGKVVMNLNR